MTLWKLTLRATAVLFLCVLVASVGRGQTFDLDRQREAVISLDGMWRFQPGDDPRWADPKFDDSKWPLLQSDRDWAEQGYRGLSGMAWYRFRVNVPANSEALSLYVPAIRTSYEVYADGARIGGFGGMPPHAEADHAIPQTFVVPGSAAAHTVTFAIRIWHAPFWAGYYGGGPQAVSSFGATPVMQERAASEVVNQSWGVVDEIVLSILEAGAGLAAFGLFWIRKGEREYFWFGVMLMCSVALRCFSTWAQNHRMSVLFRDDVTSLWMGFGTLAAITFYVRFLHGRRSWFFWIAVGSTILSILVSFADGSLLSVKQTQELSVLFALPFSAWVLTLLIQTARHGLGDARLLLFPVLLQQVALVVGDIVWLTYLSGWQHTYAQQDVVLSEWPFLFTLSDVTALLFLLAMIAILINRFTRLRREEERLEAELDAARSVQHVLIPDEIPLVPGYAITGIYKPASEVGGDFFQVIPLAELGCMAGDQSGGMLVVVGDVSGKGLQAAMNVSLIVGSLRTLIDHTQRPAEILGGLNRRLFGRSNGGFTTCMVMLVDAAGALTIATAGHLAPYRNGLELPLEDGLPLGLSLDTVYDESRFQLEPGDKMMMISDGVLEARNEAGELFGFDRTRALSTQDAAYVAAAAQDFGQEDDITVLTLRRLAVA